jgi:hypothetical protein
MDLIKQILDGKIVIAQAEETLEEKATPIDAIPQERFTGDVLKGRGPRRGNLERLLRYWRPIMRKPGGFRRCRVILADHPELYPLNNICAWLHHETTGLWPNEGCHHPNMKNCRKKMRGVTRGSLWSDQEFNDRLRKLTSRQGAKSMQTSGARAIDEPFAPVITEEDWDHAFKVMQDFVDMEPDFVKMIEDNNNWEHEHGFKVEYGKLGPMGEDDISI